MIPELRDDIAEISTPMIRQIGRRVGKERNAMLAWLRDLTSHERQTTGAR
jgi:hypothetical protein